MASSKTSMAASLSALDDIEKLLKCSRCQGPPLSDPSKSCLRLARCDHVLCDACNGDQWSVGGPCKVCGTQNDLKDRRPHRDRGRIWSEVAAMKRSVEAIRALRSGSSIEAAKVLEEDKVSKEKENSVPKEVNEDDKTLNAKAQLRQTKKGMKNGETGKDEIDVEMPGEKEREDEKNHDRETKAIVGSKRKGMNSAKTTEKGGRRKRKSSNSEGNLAEANLSKKQNVKPKDPEEVAEKETLANKTNVVDKSLKNTIDKLPFDKANNNSCDESKSKLKDKSGKVKKHVEMKEQSNKSPVVAAATTDAEENDKEKHRMEEERVAGDEKGDSPNKNVKRGKQIGSKVPKTKTGIAKRSRMSKETEERAGPSNAITIKQAPNESMRGRRTKEKKNYKEKDEEDDDDPVVNIPDAGGDGVRKKMNESIDAKKKRATHKKTGPKDDKSSTNKASTSTRKLRSPPSPSERGRSEAKPSSTPSTTKRMKGSTPSTPGGWVHKRNAKGETPLHVACIKGQLDKVRSLLEEHGASVNTRDHNGWTPLHEAANLGNVELVQLLLENENGPLLLDVPGGEEMATPLHDAAENGHIEVVKVLIEAGADKEARNKQGLLPSEIARNEQTRLIIETTEGKRPAIDLDTTLNTSSNHLKKSEEINIYSVSPSVNSLLKKIERTKPELVFNLLTSMREDTTHFVASCEGSVLYEKLDEEQIAYCKAVLMAKFVVNATWLKDSMLEGKFLEEEEYLVLGPPSKPTGAQTLSRNNLLKQRPPLFANCHIFLQGAFSDKAGVEALVKAGGATLLSRAPDPESIEVNTTSLLSNGGGRKGNKARTEKHLLQEQELLMHNATTVPYHADPGGPLARCSHFLIYDLQKPQLCYNMAHVKSLPLAWLLSSIHEFNLVNPASVLTN